mmetsp:Transcript_130282/g.362964  ORF Transcript_130282/g.362964 Transcript_130282/m.362964 type:complete len:108 (-) Transcript_130282:1876-2199(-)
MQQLSGSAMQPADGRKGISFNSFARTRTTETQTGAGKARIQKTSTGASHHRGIAKRWAAAKTVTCAGCTVLGHADQEQDENEARLHNTPCVHRTMPGCQLKPLVGAH